jgi:hypothetical protein
LNFDEVIDPADRLIRLYQRISIATLDDLVGSQLQQIGNQADADFNRFNEVLQFSADQSNTSSVRSNLITQIANAYAASFPVLGNT